MFNRKNILLALVVIAALAGLVTAVLLSERRTAPDTDADAVPTAEAAPTPTPTVPALEPGSYVVTAITDVITAPGETGTADPDGTRLILLENGTGSLVTDRRARPVTWKQCGAYLSVTPQGSKSVFAGAYSADAGTITLRMQGATYVFTYGATCCCCDDDDADPDAAPAPTPIRRGRAGIHPRRGRGRSHRAGPLRRDILHRPLLRQ